MKGMTVTDIDLKAAAGGYELTGLWASRCWGAQRHDPCRGRGECDRSLMDVGYTPDDIDGETREHMAGVVADFIAMCEREWTGDGPVFADLDAAEIGHLFYLTRNRHGAGFWDAGLGERGTFLTTMAHTYGESELFAGGTLGWVYCE